MKLYSVGYTKNFSGKVESWSRAKFPNAVENDLILLRRKVIEFCDSHDQLPSRMTFYSTLSESVEIRVGIYSYAKGKHSKIFLGAVVDNYKAQVVFVSLIYKRGGRLQAGSDALSEV